MSYVHANGAQLYYDLYGSPRPDPARAPILLIHDAGETGESDWGEIAPLLGRHYRVIVPDCRGHGRSTNPQHDYAFREMAADLAELVRRLNHERAHLVGHGHGGSIALVALLEYPEIVQTCTFEAAHAVMNPALADAWAGLLDPDWLAEQNPGRAERVRDLHSPMHGLDHWRELLRLTLEETLRWPAYAAEDLALARRPVLVMQGGQDGMHALSGDSRFLVGNIPEAEAWCPLDAGPNIHREQPWAWAERLLDFLARRGDNANEGLDRLRRTCYADHRETVFAVRAEPIATRPAGILAADPADAGNNGAGGSDVWWAEPSPVRLVGEVLTEGQRREARAVVEPAVWDPALVIDDLRVLLDDATPWALVTLPLADLRAGPEIEASRVSQALAGEVVRVLGEQDGWAHVRMEGDGCLGWLQAAVLHFCLGDEAQAFQTAGNFIVIAEVAAAYARPRRSAPALGKLPLGTVLPAAQRGRGWIALSLPDGEQWWVATAGLMPLAERPAAGPQAAAWALSLLRGCVGAPLLPGGLTPFGFDAAGLAHAYMRLLGLPAPRTLEQQFRAGNPVEGTPEAGDLVFFAHETGADGTHSRGKMGSAPVSHVAISLGGYELLQAGGGALDVNVLKLDLPATPAARWLRDHLAGVRRYVAP